MKDADCLDRIMVTETCWLWMGTLRGNGYGGAGNKYAHRWAYEYWIGPIPSGLDVCHTCDVRLCVNPDHLWAGTRSQNLMDMAIKGRHGVAKLTPEKVRAIRGDTRSQRAIAADYGVDQKTISNIKRGALYTHV